MSIEVAQYENVRRRHQMIQRWIVSCAIACWGMYTLVMINSVFPSLAVIVNSSKWGGARVSGDSGLREKFIDLWINVSKPPTLPWWRYFLTVVKFWMYGVREFKVNFDSWITATLTLYCSKNSPSSTCLLPMPLHWIVEWWRDPHRKL